MLKLLGSRNLFVQLEVDVAPDVKDAPWEHIKASVKEVADSGKSKVLCFTWNMGDAKPLDDELESWLPSGGGWCCVLSPCSDSESRGDFDIVVVGVQECSYDWVSDWVPPRNPKRRKSLKGSGKTQLPMLSGAVEEALHAFGSSPRSESRKKTRDVGEEAFSFHWDDILAERLGDSFVRIQQAGSLRGERFRCPQVVLMNMRLLVFARTQYCALARRQRRSFGQQLRVARGDGTVRWDDGPMIHSVQHTYSATGLLAGTVGLSIACQSSKMSQRWATKVAWWSHSTLVQ